MNGQRKIAIALTDSDAQSVHRMIQELGLALTSDGTQTVFFNSFKASSPDIPGMVISVMIRAQSRELAFRSSSDPVMASSAHASG